MEIDATDQKGQWKRAKIRTTRISRVNFRRCRQRTEGVSLLILVPEDDAFKAAPSKLPLPLGCFFNLLPPVIRFRPDCIGDPIATLRPCGD